MAKLPKDSNYKDYPILVIDDEQVFLEAFANEFSEFYTVYTANSAKEAMTIVNENNAIAVVLVDQKMPEMTGVQMLAQLRTQHPHITRILITGYADIEAAIDAVNVGAIFKYISKPYKYEELKQVIQRGIEEHCFSKQEKQLQAGEIERLRQGISVDNLRALNALTFGFSHHFKNKLSAAVTFFTILPDKLKELIEHIGGGIDKQYWYDYATTAEEGIKNIVELIGDLYAYSNMGDYIFEKGDIAQLFDSEKEVFYSLAQGKQIEFQYNFPRNLPLVSLDVLRMSQALENVVLNAIQAIPEKGTIKISAEEQAEAIKISVSDNGEGIEKENLKKIFYPFFTTKGPQRKGLGLSIADTIVRQHSGRIEIQSEPNQGTTVIITLPLVQPKHPL